MRTLTCACQVRGATSVYPRELSAVCRVIRAVICEVLLASLPLPLLRKRTSQPSIAFPSSCGGPRCAQLHFPAVYLPRHCHSGAVPHHQGLAPGCRRRSGIPLMCVPIGPSTPCRQALSAVDFQGVAAHRQRHRVQPHQGALHGALQQADWTDATYDCCVRRRCSCTPFTPDGLSPPPIFVPLLTPFRECRKWMSIAKTRATRSCLMRCRCLICRPWPRAAAVWGS
jgi:hypothetical protein